MSASFRKFKLSTHTAGQATSRDRLLGLKADQVERSARMAADRPRFERLADNASAPKVVSAFNLFPTPPQLAQQVAERADLASLAEGSRILEPSAGLGALYLAARAELDRAGLAAAWSLVEISPDCAGQLYRLTETDQAARLIQADFLAQSVTSLGGPFDRILMNPPFAKWSDIRHVNHARQLLAPGGLLVAIVADGPRQRAQLQPAADSWESLPAGSFKSEGTSVNTALVTFSA